MNKVKIYKSYKYRLYPTAEQKNLLARHFGACRWVYNNGLEQQIKSHAETGKSISNSEISLRLSHLKEEHGWLKEVNPQSLQRKLKCLEIGMDKFSKENAGFPKFKSKCDEQSFSVSQHFELNGGKLQLPKFEKGIKIVLHREPEGRICSVTISKTKSGKYYASILTEQELNVEQKPSEKDTAIGLDVGLENFVTTNKGEKFERIRHSEKCKKKLERLQRKLSKQKKGSSNSNKTKIKIAKVREKTVNLRKDYIHKVTRQLINENQVNTYCIETLDVLEMMKKNPELAGSIADVSWGEFFRQLAYKANWVGKHVIRIGMFETSSKTCSSCGNVNESLTLNDRVWKCDCGVEHDRDVNAAINIRNFAFN